ncbi:MAG: GNAT family protein [Aggregatilineales bacterium]
MQKTIQIPMQGEKIILRPFRTEDAEPLWESMDHAEFNKLTGTQGTFTREMIDKYIARQVANDDDSRAPFIIALPDDSKALDEVIINEIDSDNNSASIRIGMFTDEGVGKGYGTEAMRLMVNYGFNQLGLHRIELSVYAFNPRAIRAYEKVGFKREGVMRDALLWDGEYVDSISMSILDHEWTGLD